MKPNSGTGPCAVLLAVLTMTFTTICQENYADWAHSKDITINTSASGYGITENLSNFPYLVRLSKATFDFGQAQANGEDIRFANASGQHLAYQIDSWDAVSRKAAIWVNVDAIQGNNSTQFIKLYWGKSDAVSQSDGAAVFETSNGFAGVWHLNETGSSDEAAYLDATANQLHGTGVLMTEMSSDAKVPSEIGYGQFMMGSQYIKTPKSNLNSNTVTMSAWVTLPGAPGDWASPLFCRGVNTKASGMSLKMDGGFSYHWMDEFWDWTSGLTVPLGTPTFLVLAISPSNATLYVGSRGSITSAVNTAQHAVAPFDTNLVIGMDSYSSRTLYGIVDEVVLSKVTRSADWIKLSYLNQHYIAESVAEIVYPQKEYVFGVSEFVEIKPTLSDIPDSITVEPAMPYALTLNKNTGSIDGWLDDTCTLRTYHITTYNAKGTYVDSVAIGTQKPVATHSSKIDGIGPQAALLGIKRSSQNQLLFYVPAAGVIRSARFTMYDLTGAAVWTASRAGSSLVTGVQSIAIEGASSKGKMPAGVYVVEMEIVARDKATSGTVKMNVTLMP
jgi:hypothetical protein